MSKHDTTTNARPSGQSAADSAQYRLLEVGERLQDGDEYLSGGEWAKLKASAFGCMVRDTSLGVCPWGYYRRPLVVDGAKPAVVPRVVITLKGGTVQSVLTDGITLEVLTVDYDTDGMDVAELTPMPQDEGYEDACARLSMSEANDDLVARLFAAACAHEAKPREVRMSPKKCVRFLVLMAPMALDEAFGLIREECRPLGGWAAIMDAAEELASELDAENLAPSNLRAHAEFITVSEWARGKGAL